MIDMIYGLCIIAIMFLSFLIGFVLSLSKKTTILLVLSCIIFCILTIVVSLKFEIFIMHSLTDISHILILGLGGVAAILSYFFHYIANELALHTYYWKKAEITYSFVYDGACIGFEMLFAVTGIIAVISMYMLVHLLLSYS